MKKPMKMVGKPPMDDDHWIQSAVPDSHKGRLHRALGVPEDRPIPADRMAEARTSSDPHIRRMAQLADTFSHMK